MIDAVVAALHGRDVVDVGCGTAIAARQLQAAGCRVLGVDPRLAHGRRGRGYGVEVEVARFEDWDPAGRAFDGVVAGQAWHWVDPVAGAAKAARALRPGGLLALFWNAFDPPPDLAEAIGAVYRRVLPDVPIFRGTLPGPEAYSTMLDGAAEGMGAAGGFGEPERRRFDWVRDYTRDEWLEQVPTFGGHSQLLADKLREVLEGIGAAIDAVGGAFTMRYAALLISANPDGEPLTVAPRGARGRSEPLPRPNAQVAGRP